ncbi:hypothetical protein C1645_817378, partial [Glomus cerebriforme]
ATIWIAKIKNSTQLIGGYNPLDWSGDNWKATTDSFIYDGWFQRNNSYNGDIFHPDIGIPESRLEVEDYEVFQVIRK